MVPRPSPSDYEPIFEKYISLVQGDCEEFLKVQAQSLIQHVSKLSEAGSLHRYAPGKWSIKELLGHITDSDRIFAYRILCIARGESASLPGFDEDAYVLNAGFDLRSLPDLIAEFEATRNASLALIRSLSPEACARIGTANGRKVSVSALVHTLAGHAEHHLNVLRERYLNQPE